MKCPKCKKDNDDNLVRCDECNYLLQAKTVPTILKFTFGCLALLIGIFISLSCISQLDERISNCLIVISQILACALPLLSVAALIKIKLDYGSKGTGLIVLVLSISCLFLSQFVIYDTPAAKHWASSPIVCGTKLKHLGVALLVYANEHGDIFPSQNWCDELIAEADVSEKQYLHPESDSRLFESDFCMNSYAAGKNIKELPNDLVVLFEIKHNSGKEDFVSIKKRGDKTVRLNRWNQVGDYQLANVENYIDCTNKLGCNILFVDGHAEFVEINRIHTLNWNLNEKPLAQADFLTVNSDRLPRRISLRKLMRSELLPKIIALAFFAIGSILVAIRILRKTNALQYWKFLAGLGIIAGVFGGLFGYASEAAYITPPHTPVGICAGIFFGLLTGICFAAKLTQKFEYLKSIEKRLSLITSIGMAVGVLCSTLVHIAIMIGFAQTNPFGIIVGIPYGIFAGAILGRISGAIAEKCYLK